MFFTRDFIIGMNRHLLNVKSRRIILNNKREAEFARIEILNGKHVE